MIYYQNQNIKVSFSMYIILNNGIKMPLIGLGTFNLVGDECINVIIDAFNNGYTSFDTAAAYKNSEAMGIALRKLNVSRDKYFITTKLSNRDQERGNIVDACKRTLQYLSLDYVDLYLMHWPYPEYYLESWNSMETIYKQGLARAIGVCNFNIHHLIELKKYCSIIPAVNQVELHPLLSQLPLREFCSSNMIQMEAYSPLARMDSLLINSPSIAEISKKYHKTVAQVILRWIIQNNIIAIPKTKTHQRLIENINIFDFELSLREIKLIDSMNINYRVRHDPDSCDMKLL